MKHIFVILIVLLACSETKPPEKILMKGIYDHAEYTQGFHVASTIIHFNDGRAIPLWRFYTIYYRAGDSIAIIEIDTGSRRKREVRLIKEREEK